MITTDDLAACWARTTAALDLPPIPRLGSDLLDRYRQPHRTYHNARHLADVLSVLADLDADPLLQLAAWFHDAVYDPGQPDNEARSGALAETTLRASGLTSARTTFVTDAVLATADHDHGDRRFGALLDADMAVLGAPRATYRAYCVAIRNEYHAIPGADFHRGRRAFVEDLLARDHIFATSLARRRFERSAHLNLAAELSDLTTARRTTTCHASSATGAFWPTTTC